jgi:transposase-like protein
MARQRRTSTRELKAEAARRITEQGRRLAEVARDLDRSQSMLRGRERARAADVARALAGEENLAAVDEERRRPRAENPRLRAARAILRRATACFARGSS